MNFAEALTATALRGTEEKAIIGLVILDCGGLTFKPHMEEIKVEPCTKAFYEPKTDTLLPIIQNVQNKKKILRTLADLIIYIYGII